MNRPGHAAPTLLSTSGTPFKPLFVPHGDRPMRVVFFASGGPGNLRAALEVTDELPGLVRIGLVVADRPAIPSIEVAASRGIPTIVGHFNDECGQWSEVCGDLERERRYRAAAEAFHDRILSLIKHEEECSGHPFDLAVLAYRRWIHGSLLEHFHERMINQHPGDLSVLTDDLLTRRYTGLDAVTHALRAGEAATRTSTFLVRQGHDTGEILCQGPWTTFSFGTLTRETARAHENLQKEQSDWPSLKFALRGIARGAFGVSLGSAHPDGNKVVVYDHEEQPYAGVRLGSELSLGAPA